MDDLRMIVGAGIGEVELALGNLTLTLKPEEARKLAHQLLQAAKDAS